MLHTSSFGHAFGNVPASGHVQQLQVALRGLAQATANPNWDPGEPTGELTDQTLTSLASVLVAASGQVAAIRRALPTILPVLRSALRDPYARPHAMQFIMQHATQLVAAVRLMTTHYLATSDRPPYDSVPMAGLGAENIFTRARDAGRTAATSTTTKLTSIIRAPATLSPGTSPTPSAGAPGGVRIYPAGSIATKTATGAWRVAVPRAVAKAALGGVDLAEGDYVEVPGSATQPVRQSEADPSATEMVPEVDEKKFDSETKKPWYKQWQTYAIAGGVVVVIGGAYFLLR